MSGFRLLVLGPPHVERDGAPLDIGRRKTLALLLYLAVTGQAQRREELAALLWPEHDESRASAYLRRALWSLKQALGEGRVLAEHERIGLAQSPELWVDSHQFRRLLAEPHRHPHAAAVVCADCLPLLSQAAALYRGDFLSGFTLPDCPAFDEWQFFQAESLRQELAAALERLVSGHRGAGTFEPAIAFARRRLALDPLHEPAHRQLMELYVAAGQRAAALRQYAECVRVLEAEIGAPPAEETTRLYAAIKANQLSARAVQSNQPLTSESPSAPPPRPHSAAPRPTLPAPTTSFIGRAAEVAAIRSMLARPEVRLLTLSGAGGAGKTRLALRVAADLLAAFADGVFFVDLAPLSDPALVAATIAETAGVRTSGTRPVIARLKEYLQDQRALLILDNFEHVLAAAPVVTELLAAAPQLKALVTSRAVLRLSGEWDHAVPPLSTPDPRELPPLEQLGEYEAVQLFVERARAVRASFALTPANAAAVTEICVKVDGLPLAIELAAARVRVLPPEHILSQLRSRLHFLTGGARDAPTRQRTLRDTIDWSYQLLAGDEQTLFRRLAVFAGGCILEAAEAVGGWNVPTFERFNVLDGLESLVGKHLLTQADDGEEPRFRMLETIREYGLECLERSGEAYAIRQQHALFFTTLAEAAEPHLNGAGQRAWVRRLEAEHDNLRAALAWAIDNASAIGLRLAGALGRFWHFHGHHREGRDWLLKALARANDAAEDQSDHWRAKALNQAGYLAMFLHDVPQATALLEQSEALWRTVGDSRGLAQALCNWGAALNRQGDLNLARALLDESIAIFRQLGEKQGLVRALVWHGRTTTLQGDFATARASAGESIRLGREVGDVSNIATAICAILAHIAFRQGDDAAAQSLGEEHLRLMREVDDKPGIALGLGFSGSLYYRQGQYEEARPLFEERLRIWRELGSQHDSAWSLYSLGYVALRQHDRERAAALFAESLALCRELGEEDGIARCLAGLAEVAQATGGLERAARLSGATAARLAVGGRNLEDTERDPSGSIPITSQAEFERYVATVRALLGDAAFAAAWAAGRAMSLEQAVAYAVGR